MSSSSLEGVKQRLSGTGSVNGVTTFGGLAGGTLGELSDYHCCKPEGLAGGMPAMREMCSLLSCQLEDCTFGRPGGGGHQGWATRLGLGAGPSRACICLLVAPGGRAGTSLGLPLPLREKASLELDSQQL